MLSATISIVEVVVVKVTIVSGVWVDENATAYANLSRVI